jgi:proteasome lid subunit RPN8/RPN11
VIGYVADSNLQLLAQVHSHPGYFVGHSGGDIEGALMPYEGFISIVVPNYAAEGLLPFVKLGVHRFECGAFSQLSDEEINDCLLQVSSVRDFRR